MTKKEIEKKAKEIANQWQEPSDYDIARDAATEMADWALSHQWVSVEDERVTHWMPNEVPAKDRRDMVKK